MKPKTVGRTSSSDVPQLRTEMTHAGLVAGTLLLTVNDARPVESLSRGDRVATRTGGLVPLETVETAEMKVETVRIRAGTLGAASPERDVILPASHLVLVRDRRAKVLSGATQAVLPAGCLIDDEAILSLGMQQLTLVRLGFRTPYVVYADGLELSVPALTLPPAVAA